MSEAWLLDLSHLASFLVLEVLNATMPSDRKEASIKENDSATAKEVAKQSGIIAGFDIHLKIPLECPRAAPPCFLLLNAWLSRPQRTPRPCASPGAPRAEAALSLPRPLNNRFCRPPPL